MSQLFCKVLTLSNFYILNWHPFLSAESPLFSCLQKVHFFLCLQYIYKKIRRKTEYYRTGILPAKFEGMHYRLFQDCADEKTAYAISTPNIQSARIRHLPQLDRCRVFRILNPLPEFSYNSLNFPVSPFWISA